MVVVNKIKDKLTRGDSATLTFGVPLAFWSAGGHVFFAMKPQVDDDATDAVAGVLLHTFTDADIVGTDDVFKNYEWQLAPGDTNEIPLATYLAEFEFVSADLGTVVTYPDANAGTWEITIDGDVNRRTS